MAWNIIATIERHFFAAVLTVVTLAISSGLAISIWSERLTRSVPAETDLVEISGLVSHAMPQPRSGTVWLDLKEARSPESGLPGIAAVRLYARDAHQVATALSSTTEAVPVAALVVRAEIEAATSRKPPSALQLRVADKTLVAYGEGRSVREEHAANARLEAWAAGGGALVSLAVLLVFWIQRLHA